MFQLAAASGGDVFVNPDRVRFFAPDGHGATSFISTRSIPFTSAKPYGSTPKVVRVCLMTGTGACPICDFVAGVFMIVVCLAVVAWMQRHPPRNRRDEPD